MRTHIKRSVPVWLLTGACVVWWGSANAAQPEQKALGNAPKEVAEPRSSSRSEPVKPNKTVVLAKNTNSKSGSGASTTTTKPLTGEEKKAVSRCWKRLMNMVREVNHAHRVKK